MKGLNGKKIYTVVNERYLEYCVECLKKSNFEIKELCDIYYNPKFQNANNLWYILEINFVK
mgnify:CR=1 FL=1